MIKIRKLGMDVVGFILKVTNTISKVTNP